VALVESASLPGSSVRYGTLRELASIAEEVGAAPAVILMGEVLAERAAVETLATTHLGRSRAA
jgi:siroheme synthase